MKSPKNESKEKSRIWGFFKKTWRCIWNSGGSIQDCSKQSKSAQDIRDEYQKKCPWKGDLF